jgi:hypothetical protein
MADVSERDRAHFARIAEAMRVAREERVEEALERSAFERMVEGLELGYAAPSDLETELALDRRALGQAELAMRARRLGLRTSR